MDVPSTDVSPACSRSRCLNAGAEDFIVKPLQSKDVQRLRNCSAAARPSKGAAPCEAAVVAKRNHKPPHPAGAASPSGRRASLAGVAMVRTTSARRPPLPFPRTASSFRLCFSAARCCSRRAWSCRSTCRCCSSSSCWRTPCCAWASSCTDGRRRAAAARSPRGAPEQQQRCSAVQCAVLGSNRKKTDDANA